MSARTRRVAAGGRAVWAFDPRPGSSECALLCSSEDYAAVLARGFATIDGQRARPHQGDCDEESGFLRLRFDAPYRAP